ncbi:MAG: hypothetical protein MRJ68_18405 [Nitrospira sp.]|nr:hypothetical protein [Nitrospira sp.]
MSDHRASDHGEPTGQGAASLKTGTDPLELIEQCLASFPESDPRQKLLYKLRHAVLLSQAASQQRELEFKKVSEVVAKLTAPANRIGTLLDLPGEDSPASWSAGPSITPMWTLVCLNPISRLAHRFSSTKPTR